MKEEEIVKMKESLAAVQEELAKANKEIREMTELKQQTRPESTSEANSDSTDYESTGARRKALKKKKPINSLTKVLSNHEKVMRGMGSKVLVEEKDDNLREIINSFSKTNIARAIKEQRKVSSFKRTIPWSCRKL